MNRQIRAASVIAVGIAMVACPRAVRAQCELTKLTASDAASSDEFGYSVAISGDYAVVGAWKNDDACVSDPNCSSGSAYVFKRTVAGWTKVAKLVASDAAKSDLFGASVAIDGDTIVVGAFQGNVADEVPGAGAAYVFFNDGTDNWTEQAKLVADDATNKDRLGWSVAISGDVVVAGAPSNDSKKGAAYVFRRSGTDWTQEDKLVASDAFDGDELGKSVSISGEVIIVGAFHNDPPSGGNAGAAYIFRFNSGTSSWDETKKLVASDSAGNAEFGSAVSIDGNTAVVGAQKATGVSGSTGAAYLFKFDGGEWTEQAKVDALDGASQDKFGSAVSVSGDFAVVGASGDDDAGSSTGAVYFFKREAGTWVSLEKLTASDKAGSAEFGFSVALDGTFALAGARREGTSPSKAGAAYVHVVGGGQGATVACLPCTTATQATDCNDGRPCTTGICPSELGVCTFEINSGCFIEKECRDPGEANPANECEECNPISPSGWSPKAEGTLCLVGNDGVFCNGEEVCDGAGACESPGSPCVAPRIICVEDNDQCVRCLFNSDCDDGNDCTDDVCEDGTCSNPNFDPGTACGDQTIDTVCDGADTCDGNGVCKPNVADFGTPCTAPDGTDCTDDICFPDADGQHGTCIAQPKPNGTPCTDNGLFCDGPEVCSGGQCLPSNEDPCAASGLTCNEDAHACECTIDNAAACDNGLSCTVDDCDLTRGVCTHTPTDGNCFINQACYALGNFNRLNDCEECNPTLNDRDWSFKSDGASCGDDGNQCTDDTCNGTGTCEHTDKPDATPCDDGLFCNGEDTCDGAGACSSHTGDPCAATGLACDDGADSCVCTADDDCPDDGLLCTIETCDVGVCVDPIPIDPDFCFIGGTCYGNGVENPANECEECNPAQQGDDWSPKTSGTPCSGDGNGCTEDVCTNSGTDGVCSHLATVPEVNPCSDDGVFCNGEERCSGGACASSGDPCEASGLGCDEDAGTCRCNDDNDCEDGQPCTNAACTDGLCDNSPIPGKACDDGVFCNGDGDDECGTDGTCSVHSGDPCAALGLTCNEVGESCGCENDTDCDDGDFCNGVETCDKEAGATTGECQEGVRRCLGEGKICNEEQDRCDCDDSITDVCDDGNFCTGTESCVDGVCVASGDPCVGQGLACDERGNRCPECLVGDDCDDGDACTFDRCPNGVCTHTPKAGCNDSDLDGVDNDVDDCPGTIPGALVDSETGCSCDQLDDDDDGVDNCVDACANTPDDERIETETGCSCSQLDDDGDGVDNCLDECPDSPNVDVDEMGCPTGGGNENDNAVNGNDNTSGGNDNAANGNDNAGGAVLWELTVDFTPEAAAGVPVPSERFADGEVAKVPVPTHPVEFEFVRWDGDVPAGQETADPLLLTMDADKTITAVFQEVGTGNGNVSSQGGSRRNGACGLFSLFNLGLIALTLGALRLTRRRRV